MNLDFDINCPWCGAFAAYSMFETYKRCPKCGLPVDPLLMAYDALEVVEEVMDERQMYQGCITDVSTKWVN